jgi:hypothetical protein
MDHKHEGHDVYKDQLKRIILVNGKADAATAFQERLRTNGLDQFVHPDLYARLEI